MKKYYPYLQNFTLSSSSKGTKNFFFEQLDSFVTRKEYVKITLLDWEENPIEELQGQLTGGTINKDGSSSVRRSGSLSTILDPGSYTIESLKSNFSLNKKVFIELGVDNNTTLYQEYPIVWFPQGVFFISDFSCSINVNGGVSANISLKDKMLRLSGDIGGLFNSTTVLDEKDTLDEVSGKWISKKVLIYDLIQELVHHFGGEPLENIVIQDIPLKIKSVVKWTGSSPLYLTEIKANNYLPSLLPPTNASGTTYVNGEDVGYIYSDFVYTEELTANAGESICSVLDKIKQYLGNFEYFYDEFGVFHFQEIKNYLNTTQATSLLNEMDFKDYVVNIGEESKNNYIFSTNKNLISMNVTPQYGNIKNDYVIQGVKKATGSDISTPIFYHLAIDSKPKLNSHSGVMLYKEKEDSTIVKAAFPSLLYYNTGSLTPPLTIQNSIFTNYSDLYDLHTSESGLEIIRDNVYQEWISDVTTKYNIDTIDKVAEKADKDGSVFYYTVKKEELDIIAKTGSSLVEYLREKGLIQKKWAWGDSTSTEDLKTEVYKDFQVILDNLLQYTSIPVSKYSLAKENSLKNAIGGLTTYQNKTATDSIFGLISNFYFYNVLGGYFTLEEAIQKIISLFTEKSELWFNSSENNVLFRGNTLLVSDNNETKHFFKKIPAPIQTPRSLSLETENGTSSNVVENKFRRIFSWSPKSANSLNIVVDENSGKWIEFPSMSNNGTGATSFSNLRFLDAEWIRKQREKRSKLDQEITSASYPSEWEKLYESSLNITAESWPAFKFSGDDRDTAIQTRIETVKKLPEDAPGKATAKEWVNLQMILEENAIGRNDKENQKTSESSIFGMVEDIKNYDEVKKWINNKIEAINSVRASLQQTFDNYPYPLALQSKANYADIKKELTSKIDKLNKIIADKEIEYNELANEPVQQNTVDIEIKDYKNQLNKLNEELSEIENKEQKISLIEAAKETYKAIAGDQGDSRQDKLPSYLKYAKAMKVINNNINNEEAKKDKVKELLFNVYLKIEDDQEIFENNQKQLYEDILDEYSREQDEVKDKLFRLLLENFFYNYVINLGSISYEIPEKRFYFKEIATFWNGSEWQEVYPVSLGEYQSSDWRTELYLQGLYARANGTDSNSRKYKEDVNFYFEELEAYWPLVYSLQDHDFYGNHKKDDNGNIAPATTTAVCDGIYYLDFIEPHTTIGEFCVKNIGRRQQVTCDEKINCLFAPEVPNVIFLDNTSETLVDEKKECDAQGQPYAQVSPEIYWALSTGGHRNPAFDQIKYELFLHTNYQKTISFTAIPSFYLEPNRLIQIEDYLTNTFGNFVVKNISLTLGKGGTMSISANESFERF